MKSVARHGQLKHTGQSKLLTASHSQSGITLIQTCLLIVILSLLIAGGLTLSRHMKYSKALRETDQKITQLQTIFQSHIKDGKPLPCPAPLGAQLDTAGFGASAANCGGTIETTGRITAGNVDGKVFIGAIPTRTLNIPDSMTTDGWGRKFVYAVTAYHTAGTPNFAAHGALKIVDGQGNNATSADSNVIFLILSPGADPRGAYTLYSSEPIEACDTGTLASENCDNDSVFLNDMYKAWDAGSQSNTGRLIYKAGS